MVVTDEGIMIDVMETSLENAEDPMFVTEVGMLTVKSLEQ
jgi:hypothetical protein